MYAGISRTNRAITATHWNGTTWSNGKPNTSRDAYIDADYSTSEGNFSCRDLVITVTSVLTIVTDSYVKVLRDLVQSPTSKIKIKDKGNLMFLHKSPSTESAKLEVEAIFPDHQLLDYEFISSPISGIPLKTISPGTLDNRFYTYSEAENTFLSLNPNNTLTTAGIGYNIRVPNNFSTINNNWNVLINNYDSGNLRNGTIKNIITKDFSGINILGNPYISFINLRKFLVINTYNIQPKVYYWSKSNGAQGSSYPVSNLFTDNLNFQNEIVRSFRGFLVTKKNNSPPNEVVFTPDMMLYSKDYSTPDRLYVKINQSNVNLPIGGFCYDIKRFPIPFEDIISAGAITIIDNGFKTICRKDSFTNTDIIQIRVLFETSGTYTISTNQTLGIFDVMPNIYLVDNENNVTHNLKSSGYTFTSPAGEFLSRFYIKFQA